MADESQSGAQAKRERRRDARLERQQAAGRSRRTRQLVIGALAVAVVAALVVVIVALVGAGGSVAENRVRVPDEGRQHVAVGVDPGYQSVPPASGPHYPITSRYGVFSEPVAPGFWVHNLEHGAVVLLYRCDTDCTTVAAQLEPIFQSLPDGRFGDIKLVATPFAPLTSPVVLVAWGWQEELAAIDADRIEQFYRDFVDRGPENAP